MRNLLKLLLLTLIFGATTGYANSNINFSTNLIEKNYNLKEEVNPSINVNSNNLNQFIACLGSASQSQSFTVSGTDLNSDIVITAPTGYEISNDGGTTWQNTITLSETSGNVNSTTILIRISAITTSLPNSSNIILNSGTGGGSVNETIQIHGYILDSNNILPGTITGNQTVCGGGNPAPFVSSSNGNDGLPNSINSTNSYIWQSSTNNTTWTTIPGANNATYNPPSGIIITTYYRRILVVTVGNNFPCLSDPSNTLTVTVNNSFAVNAGADILVCKGQSINLSATSSGTNQNVSYHWSGPNGFNNNSQSATISNATVSMNGNYTVTASINSGCQVSDVVNVLVYDTPDITSSQFQNGILVECTTSPTQTDGIIAFSLTIPNYSNNILNYTINWGTGSPSTEVLTSADWNNLVGHIYNLGLNTFSITINFINGCSTTKNYSAFVGSSPAAATLVLNQNQANGCAPLTTQWTFTVPNNVDGTTYTGTWGETSTQDNFVYTQGGTAPQATSTMTWSNPSVDPITLVTTYIITKTYQTSSCGSNVIIGPNTYYNAYQPIVITQNPCTVTPQPSGTALVSVGKKPTASFNPAPFPSKICIGVPLQLTNTSDFGQTIPALNGATCLTTGKFYWTVTALTPVAPGAWTATGLGTNIFSGNPQTNFNLWTNGSTTPSITFNQTGNYRICLYVANSCGVDTICKDICVQSKVTPVFTIDNTIGCKPMIVTTNNTSDTTVACDHNLANNTNPSVTYQWNITYNSNYCGISSNITYLNSTNSNSINPILQFNNPGIYSISLTATDDCGSLTSPIQTVTIKQPPTVSINSISNYCATASINPTAIINSCSNITTNNPTYLWSFPGSNTPTSTALNPTNIQYATPGTYTVTLEITNECGTTIATKSFTIFETSVGGTASANQTICPGIIPNPITLTGNIGAIQWQSASSATGPWTNIAGATNPTLSISALNSTTYYQAIVTNGICPPAASTIVTITVTSPSVGGIASANQTICTGLIPSALMLTGNTGSIQWQTANSSSGPWTDIIGETNITLVLGPLTSTTYYQAIVTSGLCTSATSTKVTITVSQPSVSGTASADQTICFGTTPTPLFLTGQTGTIQWQTATSPTGTWNNIPGATGITLTSAQMGALTTTKYYQAVVTSGACPAATSNLITITVNPISVGGTASSNQTICSGATPNALTLAGYTGTIQWQSAPASTGPWTNITGQTNATLVLGSLSATTYYQAVVISGVCPSAFSTKVTITVNPLPTISGNSIICIGATSQLTGSATATATPWSSSNPGVATVSNSGLVTGISAGSTVITYTNTNGCQNTITITVNPLPTISGTLFACIGSTTQLTGSDSPSATNPWTSSSPLVASISNSGLVTANSVGTSTITYTNINGCSTTALITVNPLGQVNTISDESLCHGGNLLINFTTNTVTGTTTYNWTSTQNPSIGINPSGNGDISFTASYTGAGIGTSTVIVTPTYTNGGVACPGPSSQFTISVYPPPTISVQPTPIQNICIGGTVPEFTVGYINGYGTPDYQWFYNTSPTITGATVLSGAINPTYTPPSFLAPGTYYYFAKICLNGLGCGCVYSNIAEVIVYGDPNATITPLTQTICQNTPPTPVVVTANGGINGNYTYLWYTNVAPNNIGATVLNPIQTSSTFIPPTNLVGTNYYYCVVNGGLNCDYETPVVQVVTVAAPIAHTQPLATQTVCISGTPTTLSVDFINGTGTPTYQWYSNSVADTATGTAIAGATALNYTPPTSATGTIFYYCIATYNTGGCTTATSNIAEVIVNPIQTISTQPLASQDICVSGTIAPLSVAYTGGVGTASYQWYSNTNNLNSGGLAISGANAASYTPPTFNSIGDFYFYATVTLSGSGCNTVPSNTALVHVVADPTVTITPTSQTICQNTTPTNLQVTPSDGIGTYSYQWYSNTTSNTSTGTLIPGETNATTTPINSIVGTTYYYCVITQTGLGCSVTSPVVSVQVVAAPAVNTQPLATQTVCLNGAPTALAITLINGTGTPTYQWYSNSVADTATGTAIAGATALNYTPPTSATGTIFYYCIATYNTGGCTTATSNIAEVIVNPIQTISTQPLASQDICVSGTIAPLSVAYTGGVGTASYQWYSNTNNLNSGGLAISGANTASYTPPTFNSIGDFYFYATVTLSGSGCNTVPSNTALVHVVADPTVTITPTSQTICQNTTPTNLQVTPSDGIGTYSYQWYSNTTSNTSTGTLIPGETNATTTPINSIVGTTYYYCVITQTGLGCSVTSPVVSVQVVAAPAVNTQPLATQTVCLNGAPTALAITLINGTGTPTYQWYSNSVADTATGTAIAGATALNYTPPTSATGTIFYYCIATYNTGGCTTATSNIAEVIVNPIQTISTQPLASQDICVSGTIAPLSVAYTGGVGTASYQWYSNTNNLNSGGLAISGANAASYTPPTFNSIGDFYFYATVTLSGSGCNTVPSNTALVHVVADPTVTITPTSQTICQNTTPTNLQVTPSDGIGTYSYQWYSNTTSNTSTGTLIPGETNATTTPINSIVGTTYYYCVITQTGLGCSVTSPVVSVQVVAAPAVNTQPLATQTVCLNGAPTALAITLINGTGTPTYQWYSNSVADTATGTAIAGATALNYTPPTSATGTIFYYCIATYNTGGCTTATSNIAEVIVNPIQTISTQPLASQDICVSGTIAPLSVAYTGGVGTASYQWYSNTNNLNSGGLAISGANAASYTPPTFNSIGDFYFYATVTLSGSGCNTVPSNTALVHVVADPTVTITPTSQTICQNTTPTNLQVTPSDGIGTYSYQWYSNTTSNTSTGTLIPGETNATTTPINSIVGTTYYYCVITQTGLGCSVTSNASQVTIVAVPTISVQPISNQIVCQNDPTTTLDITVVNGTGIPTYQWYSNTVNSLTGSTAIVGANGPSYIPSSSIPSTTYYYCIIQYASGNCGSLTSNISEVITNSIAFIPNKTATICSGDLYTFNPTGSVLPEIVPTGTQYTWFVDPMPSPLVTGASDNLGLPLASISQTINNNDTVPHTIVYHVTPITGNCQGAPFTISVTINPKVIPNEIIGNVQCNSFPPLCNGSITLNPTPTGNGVFSYLWSIPGTTTSQINLCPGNYTVDITDSYSCTYNFPYTVTVPPAMISVPTVNPVNNTNCDVPASCNGIIQVVISGGTPFASTTNPYQFQWFEVIGGTNIPITNSLTQVNTSILQNLCGGTYLLVVTDSVNCQRQFGPYTITNPSSLVVTSTVSNYNGFEVSCNGGNNGIIGINVTGGISSGISITLNPGNITLPNPATFTGLTAGSYTAVIHDSMNNCPDIIRNFILTQPAAPVTASLNVVSPAQCFGNQAIYEAIPSGGTGGYTYLWSNGVTTPVVSNIPSGAFTCIITDSNGCQFTLNGVNNSPPLLVASAVVTSPILCFGGTATISVSATGGTPGYSGDIGIHTGVPAGSSPIYTITDSNGCQATVSIAVAQPPYLQVSTVITTPVSCFGGTATVTVSATGGTPGYIGTGTIPLPGGNNTITVTDANGCTNSAQIYIPQPPQLVATASLTSPILCNGSTGIITISGTGGTPFGTAPFYTGTGPITVTAGTGSYSISDANGCTALTAPFTVNEPTPVVATAIITSPILCHGGSAIVSVNATGGVVGITGYTGTGNFVVPAGTYTYLVKDSNNCISTVTITVTQPPLLVATATVTSPILCFGGTATVLVTAAGGTIGTAGYFGAIGNHTVTAGTYTYNVIDANGCVATTSITVTQPGLLGFTIKSVTNPNCFPNRLYDNGSICIKIFGGTAPFPVGTGWVQSTTIPNEWCLSGLTAGSYTISVADINNCPSTSQTITLTQPTPLTATVSSNINVNCSIKEVSQTNIVLASGGIPGYSYSWSGGDSCLPVNPQCMTTTVNGNYTAFVNDQEGLTLGCIPIQAPITINLPSIGNPLMSITSYSGTTCGNFAVDDPITLTNISTGDYTSIQWLTDGIPRGNTNSIIHNFSTIGDHTITLIVNYTIGGVTCTYSISEVISITKGYDMVVPNAFTPGNNDNINDTIKPEFNCMSNVEMRVYDTWGSLLYVEAGATLIGWDGKINGRESENGNYIIVVKATTLFGAEINYNGPFTLLK